MPRILLPLLLALLLGCSGPESPAEPTPSPATAASAAAAEPDSRPLIIAFGDSLTAGYRVPDAASYPTVLQGLLDKAGYEYRVVNEGISGETSDQAVARVGLIVEQKPDWVIVEFGGNDGLRGYGVEITQGNLEQVVSQLKAAGIRVLLVGIKLPPNYGKTYTSAFEAMFPAVSDGLDVPLLPFLLEDVFGVDGMIQDDGVHPTAAGNRLVARNVFEALAPLLDAAKQPSDG